MIVVKIMGGLGNQMFQYAAGLSLAKRLRTGLMLDTSEFKAMASIDTPRDFALHDFALTAKVADDTVLSKIQQDDTNYKLHHKLLRRVGNRGKIWRLGEPSAQYFSPIKRAPNNTYLVGWWQNERYFNDIRSAVIKEFQPRRGMSAYSQEVLNVIQAKPVSISLHVRRGDYLSNPHASKFHGLAPLAYYKKAVKYMQDKFPDVQYVVFSDDIAWCKKSLKLSKGAIYYKQPEKNRDYEEIIVMSHCSHNIIANSSFSWWGAWLNSNPTKIVIAPKNWFADKKANTETEIVPSAWVRL